MDTLDISWFLILAFATIVSSVNMAIRIRRFPECPDADYRVALGLSALTLLFVNPVVSALYDHVKDWLPSPGNPWHSFTAWLITALIVAGYVVALAVLPTVAYRRVMATCADNNLTDEQRANWVG